MCRSIILRLDSRRAFTRTQTIIVIFALIIALSGGVFYYFKPRAFSPFSIHVTPEFIGDSYPGQKCIFLVNIEDEGGGRGKGEAVSISVLAREASVTVEHQEIYEGQVTEVIVKPAEANANSNLTITFVGERQRLEETDTSTIWVGEAIGLGPNGAEDPMAELATGIQDKFIPWLAEHHPEFDITEETGWTNILIRPHHMVVMYYLFLSDEWEMGLTWHVMIPPHDWARIYLRHRYNETSPSYAFELSSYTMEEYEIKPVSLVDAFAISIWR